jgi:hypothetical protein
MGNTIDLLSDTSPASDSDNESIHSDHTTLLSTSKPNPKNEDEEQTPKRKANATKPKATKPTANTNGKDLAKEDSSIESRGFHRHGAISWYNAELVMLGMAYALLKDKQDIDA